MKRTRPPRTPPLAEPIEQRLMLSVATRPAYNSGTGFFVSGGKVYDANGAEFIIRGFNQNHWWGSASENLGAIPQGAKTGANAVRAVFFKDLGAPSASTSDTPAERRAIVEQYIANNLVPIVEDHGATENTNNEINTPAALVETVDNWLDPANVAWLKQYEREVILNIANEWGPSWSASNHVWRDTYLTQLARLRGAGINNLIMIDAGGWGQDINTLKFDAAALLNADPQHNIVFSIHFYSQWRTEDRSFDVGNGIFSVQAELAAVQSAGLPIVVGEFAGEGFEASPYRARRVLEICHQMGIGYMGWGWAHVGETLNMVYDNPATGSVVEYQYNSNADLTAWGNTIINDPDYGIKATAKRATIFTAAEAPRLILENTTINAAETGQGAARVRLSAPPSGTLVVNFTRIFGGDASLSVAGASAITFTPDNWNQYQPVLVAAAADADTTPGTARFQLAGAGLQSVDFTARELDSGLSPGLFTLTPTHDRDTQSDVAAGTNATLFASKWNYLYLQFDLANIGGRAANAVLRLYKAQSTNNLTTRVWFVPSDAWTQAGTPPPLGYPALSQVVPNAAGYVEFNLTALVNGELRGNRILTLAITTNSDNWTSFNSKEAAANVRPQLVVTSVEAVPPLALASSFDYATAINALWFTFSEDVSASLSNLDVVLQSVSDPTVTLTLTATPTWDAASNRATFTFAPGVVPDGTYRATLLAGGVTDVAGNSLLIDTHVEFQALAGDVDRDGAVGFSDLLILAQNYGQSERLFGEGNVDRSEDGVVGFDDLLMLAQQYGKSLAVAAPTVSAATVGKRRSSARA